jgi:hypothetical protein
VKFRQQPSRSSSLLFLFAYFHFLSLLNTEFNFNAAARALIQVAARRLLFFASRTRKGRRAGGKKAALLLWHFYVCLSVYLMGAARGFLLRFQRIDLHFSSAAGGGSRTRKVFEQLFSPGWL